ncbi:MAG TPA: hypothetical protein VMN36_03735 [Verrucomicrobiales bacterium]|nr:hypothetical protein [Verrucomicrobiales bacterium]
MNPEPDLDSTLLDELVSDAAQRHAPPLTTVLAQLRDEKRRRLRCRRFQAAAALLFIAAVFAALWTQRTAFLSPHALAGRELPPASSPPMERPAPAGRGSFERIDDPAMLRELSDQPAALATFPDGSQQLILLVSLPPRESASAD